VRQTAPSLPLLVGLEIRKSLSTRSGKALAVAAALLAPAGALLASAESSEDLGSITGPLAVMGLLTGYLLISMGVLSTAGEWSHRSVQTTYLLVPQRGRVLATKAVAVALLGAALAALSTALTSGVLAVMEDELSWDGAWQAVGTVVAAGAAFAVIGAGVGAALGNTPGALTGLYLVLLGVLPVLLNVKPELAEKIDPASAVLNLAGGAEQSTSIAILVGWVVVSTVAGWILTHRRAVS
jgi:ABC-2 type transport system permease protein